MRHPTDPLQDGDIAALLRNGQPGDEDAARRAAQRVAEHASASGEADLAYASLDSPVGELLIGVSEQGLVRLAYIREPGDEDAVLDELARRLSPRIVHAAARTDTVRRELYDYLAGRRRAFDVPLDLSLMGPFQQRVLAATAAIPYGSVRTYTEVAAAAGNPRASRAAGNALGANPIAIIVPCHRVLRTGGGLGGYAGGLDRKQWLLELEGTPAGPQG